MFIFFLCTSFTSGHLDEMLSPLHKSTFESLEWKEGFKVLNLVQHSFLITVLLNHFERLYLISMYLIVVFSCMFDTRKARVQADDLFTCDSQSSLKWLMSVLIF